MTSGCTDKGIRKFEFVAKTQMQELLVNFLIVDAKMVRCELNKKHEVLFVLRELRKDD